jgi:hypothetical protein
MSRERRKLRPSGTRSLFEAPTAASKTLAVRSIEKLEGGGYQGAVLRSRPEVQGCGFGRIDLSAPIAFAHGAREALTVWW